MGSEGGVVGVGGGGGGGSEKEWMQGFVWCFQQQ